MGVIRDNPNASTVGGVTLLASLVTWGAGALGYQLEPAVSVAIAGAISTAVLFVGRTGIRGLARMIWQGKEEPT